MVSLFGRGFDSLQLHHLSKCKPLTIIVSGFFMSRTDSLEPKAVATRAHSLFNHLDKETERAETVVAANHSTHGILHPAIVEVALASG